MGLPTAVFSDLRCSVMLLGDKAQSFLLKLGTILLC